ncbi:MAG: Na+/H+ antiporter subunit D, partial [Desulfitobacterium sp.]|nr:Na+/H+ antiporter subunit D [Desulfitobacterium sp.]
MNNLVVLPLVLPVIAGMIMVVFRKFVYFHRALSLFTMGLIGFICILLIGQIQEQGIQTLHMGGWVAPFGISFVADMFSTLLVLVTAIVAFCCLYYAFSSIGIQRERHYFYPLTLFIIAGVNGAFLTGDIFNLFVCFEVMLVASYVLITLGGEKVQLKNSIPYVLINMISS